MENYLARQKARPIKNYLVHSMALTSYLACQKARPMEHHLARQKASQEARLMVYLLVLLTALLFYMPGGYH